jgi:hypothetical protein
MSDARLTPRQRRLPEVDDARAHRAEHRRLRLRALHDEMERIQALDRGERTGPDPDNF